MRLVKFASKLHADGVAVNAEAVQYVEPGGEGRVDVYFGPEYFARVVGTLDEVVAALEPRPRL